MSFSSRIDAHYSRMKANKEFIDRVQNCKDNCEECNDWEIDFLDSVYERLLHGGILTDRQNEKLADIEIVVSCGREALNDDL